MKKIFLVFSFALAISFLYSSAAQAIVWPSNFVQHNNIVMNAATYEPSGLAWNQITNKLFTVCNTGKVTMMDLDGSNQDTKNMASYMDFEAITVVNPATNKVYIGDENPDSIMEYDWTPAAFQDLSKPGTEVVGLTGKTWDLTSVMDGAANQGLEGLTFVPNGFHPFPDSASGGVFYAAIQRPPVLTDAVTYNDYLIYAFDIDLNTSNHIVKWWGIPVAPNTPTSDISDLYFSKDTGILYVLYDGANRLIEMRTDGTVIKDYSNIPVADQEGLVVKTNYPSLTADVYLGSDSQKLIGWYSGYPVNYDVDGDGVENSVDCAINNKTLSVKKNYYQDLDGDGLGSDVATSVCSLTPPASYVSNSDDLNDNDFDNDGVITANDCNDNDKTVLGKKTYYKDSDGDGLGSKETTLSCSQPSGYVSNSNDLNDNDFDNDGVSTEADCNDKDKTVSAMQTYYQDLDNDGKGSNASQNFCLSLPPTGYVGSSANDCNDNDKTVWENKIFYKDADGDGVGTGVAENLCFSVAPLNYTANSQVDCNDNDKTVFVNQTYYKDADGDGHGYGVGESFCLASAPSGYVSNASDSNDDDFDNDGVSASSDCNDKDDMIWALETYHQDKDGDGLGSDVAISVCSLNPPAGYVANSNDANDNDHDNDKVITSDDCDDNDANVGAQKSYYQDNDGDGLGFGTPLLSCSLTPPAGYATNHDDLDDEHKINDYDGDGVITANDCNDNDKTVWTLQTYYQDLDKDGLGSDVIISACSLTPPVGYVANSDDLNDNDFDNDGVSAGADCNDADISIGAKKMYYKDADGDGLGTKAAGRTNRIYSCSLVPPAGYVSNNQDMNDHDFDNDGVRTGRDCDDTNPLYFFRKYYYQDLDGDGLGNGRKRFYGCVPPQGYVANARDKNDNRYDNI